MQIRKTLGYYWPHVKKYKWGFSIALLAFAGSAIFGDIIIPLIYKEVFDLMTTAPSPQLAWNELSRLMLVIGGLLLALNISNVIAEYTYPFYQSKVMRDLYDFAFKNTQKHSEDFFSNNFTGGIVAKIKRFQTSFERIQDVITFQVWYHGILLLSTIAVLAWVEPMLSLLFSGWLILFVFGTFFFIKPMSKRNIAKATEDSKTTSLLADSVTNTGTIKMFANSLLELNTFKKQTAKEEFVRQRTWMLHNHLRVYQMIMVTLAEFIIMFVAIKMWSMESISMGTIVLLQIYLFKAFGIVWNLGRQIVAMTSAFADAKEIIDIFETPIDVKDVDTPEQCKIKDGNIEVKNISFSYHKGEYEGEKIFDNFSLNIASGERVGLVGHSGSGKTTITKLLLRFMDVDSGEILIDGQNIANIKQDDLRRNISYVPQDPILFHRSLRENIAYGKSNATEKEIIQAAKAANAHEFISSLPEGYDTLVGERGVKLSGGERQRVAIARAMLKDAPILILDEATSALDSISEKKIQEAFERLMQGRTTLAIAHRLSTVQKMDRIIVFDKGTIAEQGTHKELTKQNGIYAELWAEQSSGFIS